MNNRESESNHGRGFSWRIFRDLPLSCVLAFLLTSSTAQAQSSSAHTVIDQQSVSALPQFEVAAIKPWAGFGAGPDLSHGNLTLRAEFLSAMLLLAYDVTSPVQIDLPKWTNAARFDVFAKAGHPVPEKQVKLMLQRLLVERFKLVMHREVRNVGAEVMTVAKGGPKFGPGFKLSDTEGPLEGGPVENGHWIRKRISMAYLARMLGSAVDKTGLQGRYDVDMNIGKYEDPTNTFIMSRISNACRAALEPELGLKLHWEKVSLDVIVVDRGEKLPSEN
jgi:uncharacterized protein (TIGR03435 family)